MTQPRTIPKLKTIDDLRRILDNRRTNGKTIVMTNGCFDVLHVGHVRYLKAARALGDLLVVALNADESVRRLKGANRPVNTLRDRAEILAAFPFVTYLCAFDTDSVEPLVRTIKPDILTKGGDYTIDQVVGAPFMQQIGGRVVILENAPGRSSTATIAKLSAQQ